MEEQPFDFEISIPQSPCIMGGICLFLSLSYASPHAQVKLVETRAKPTKNSTQRPSTCSMHAPFPTANAHTPISQKLHPAYSKKLPKTQMQHANHPVKVNKYTRHPLPPQISTPFHRQTRRNPHHRKCPPPPFSPSSASSSQPTGGRPRHHPQVSPHSPCPRAPRPK